MKPAGKQGQDDCGQLETLKVDGTERKTSIFLDRPASANATPRDAGSRAPGWLLSLVHEGPRSGHRLDWRKRVYLAPKVSIIDEIVDLPLDGGRPPSFICARYERGSIILTSNESYGDIRRENYRLKDRSKSGRVPTSGG